MAFYLEAQAARSQLESLRSSLDLSAESLRLTVLRYQAGEATALEVVDAQSTLAAARNAYDDGLGALSRGAGGAPDSDRKVLTMRIRTSLPPHCWLAGLLCSCSKEKEKEEEPVLPVQVADVEHATHSIASSRRRAFCGRSTNPA